MTNETHLLHDLIEQAKAGNETAWEQLFDLFDHHIVVWVREKRVRPGADDDVVQAVWIKVAKSLHQFDPTEGTFRGWLFTVTANLVTDHFRKLERSRERTTSDGELDGVAPGSSGDPEDNVPSVRELEVRAASEIVRQRISEQSWEAMWRTVAEERMAAEVAGELGMSKASVRMAKSRVLRLLRECLEDPSVAP